MICKSRRKCYTKSRSQRTHIRTATCRSKRLYEERDAFAIGCIPNLQTNINLTDTRPVQTIYTAIPRPLYPEVNHYLKDLLNKNFIRKSKSPYCSSVVCVRKKDGGMRLCVDYRELNKKTVQDRHPIPGIQETLDNPGGKQGSER